MKKIIFYIGLLLPSSVFGSSLPLIHAENLEYLGAFKVPASEDMSYGGSVLAFNAAKNSLFIGGSGGIAEITIEAPVNDELSAMNRASYLQTFSDITEGNKKNIAEDGTAIIGSARLGGLLVYDKKLIGTSFGFYTREPVLSHFTSGLTLSEEGDFSGMFAVGEMPEVPTASFVSGWMTHVPRALQSELGGPVLTGNGNLSIISRTSYGPSAFSFNPDDLGETVPAPATALFYYHNNGVLNGSETGAVSSPIWNLTTKMAGMEMVEGSRSVLYFGYHGIGDYNYGESSSRPIYAFTCTYPDSCIISSKGFSVCSDPNSCTTGRKGLPNDPECDGSGSGGCFFDPTGMGAKGPHAYPYVYNVWAYDANDLAAVKNGSKAPEEVLPYGVWNLPFPVIPAHSFGGASAYDPDNEILYVVQLKGESDGYLRLPLIHAFHINMSASIPNQRKVKGRVVLLDDKVKLQLNGSETITVASQDKNKVVNFEFSTSLSPEAPYNVRIVTQPSGDYNCRVMYGAGIVDKYSDVDDILIYCDSTVEKNRGTLVPIIQYLLF